MTRYRLTPSPAQAVALREHCAHARYVWNLPVEQQSWWRPGRASAPGYLEQRRQLTQARAEHPFAGPADGTVVGIDRGVTVSAALSTGEMLCVSRPSAHVRRRRRQLERKLARAIPGSRRRARVKLAVARLKAREADTRKDWAEKTSTSLACRFDVIRVEDLRIRDMTRSARGAISQAGHNVRAKAGLNRGIMASGWGLLVRRLEQKAPGRVEKINPRFTSQRCSACGHIAAESRKSQAAFACVACGFACHADVNAARNIAAGHAVTAWGRPPAGGRANREPQRALLPE